MITQAQYQAQRKYDKNHTKSILLKLNLTSDADILAKLNDMDNKQGYVKELIRRDILGIDEVLDFDSIRYLIQPVAKRNHFHKVYLFGSYARGDATAKSDVDLMIDGGNFADIDDYLSVKNQLEEAFGKSVDLVMMEAAMANQSRAGRRLQAHFHEEKVLIYGEDQ